MNHTSMRQAGPLDAAANGRPHASAPSRPPLLRPKHGRMLCGVCRGVSIHVSLPVWAVRFAFIAASAFFAAGPLAYVMLWILVPQGDPLLAARQPQSDPPWRERPLARGNRPYAASDDAEASSSEADGNAHTDPWESIRKAPKPALFSLAGLTMLCIALLMATNGLSLGLIVPALMSVAAIAVAWLHYDAQQGRLLSMLCAVGLLFAAFVFYVFFAAPFPKGGRTPVVMAGLALLAGVGISIVPWISSLIADLGTERALKEREEERADMTAHLHDGVLQTLALIQLHGNDPATVQSLARQQERELRDWLYQERTPSERSVNAGLRKIAADIEDAHAKTIEVVTVGDARPSEQTDALLDAAKQALVNAVTHGAEPISVYCEVGDGQIEAFVRDHGEGFDIHAIAQGRLGIRESIIGRIRRRGGTVEIVSRPQWGTEVRMHMPLKGQGNGGVAHDE